MLLFCKEETSLVKEKFEGMKLLLELPIPIVDVEVGFLRSGSVCQRNRWLIALTAIPDLLLMKLGFVEGHHSSTYIRRVGFPWIGMRIKYSCWLVDGVGMNGVAYHYIVFGDSQVLRYNDFLGHPTSFEHFALDPPS
ncbi:hypothetical protein E5676_scaffold1300G00010 [Cucumis melo var. makuwa]|uniref:Uncharacterized protein n=1 Tax=Cucumis melo var. makuwa TaxID=1194695 RepID=A0A5D3CB98_CUCMM|nr:hypothetical protein E5676_scaffold1300G00010 [Cucumis melo var. makuwa]